MKMTKFERRTVRQRRITLLAMTVALVQLTGVAASQEQAQVPDIPIDALRHAQSLLRSSPLVDGHNDLPWLIREEAGGDVALFRLDEFNDFDTDIPRLRKGHVGAQFWSVWIPGETDPADTERIQLEQIKTAQLIIDSFPDTFEFAGTADDIDRIFKERKIASLLGMEGGYALNNSLDSVHRYFDLGVRYMTLTHNVTLDWADAALGEQRHGGLTDFGRDVVKEMNRVGMMVDIAHTSPATMHQALDVAKAPVIWSHAAARALVDHPRNVPDEVLKRLPDNGGVVMVTFIPSFVSLDVWEAEKTLWPTDGSITSIREYREKWLSYDAEHGAVRTTVERVADHIEHIRNVAGVDHVGIGSDYWGMPDMPLGLEDVSALPNLIAVLHMRGWTDDDLRKVAGQNTLRVMREVETVAEKLQQ